MNFFNKNRNLDDTSKAAIALTTLALIYGVLCWGVLPRHVFFSGDEGEKAIVVASTARRGDLWHPFYEYPGQAIDPQARYIFALWVKVIDGQPVPWHLSTLFFLNPPLYRLFGFDGLYVLPLLAGIGVAWLAWRLAKLAAAPRAWVVPLLAGLGTPAFFFSLTTWDHMPVVLYATLLVYLMALQVERRRLWLMALAGVLAGLGLWSRYEMYLFVAGAVLAYAYVFRQARDRWWGLLPFAGGLGVIVAAMLAQQTAVYGGLSGNILSGLSSAGTESGLAVSWFDQARNLILRQANIILFLTVDGSAVWGERVLLACGFALTVLVGRVERLQRPVLVVGAVAMQIAGTVLAFVHPRLGHTMIGLVPTVPLASLALSCGVPAQPAQRTPDQLVRELILTLSVLFLMLGLFLLPAFGGLSWGPRYLAPLFPLLAILAWAKMGDGLAAAHAGRDRTVMGLAWGAILVCSLVVQMVGVKWLYDYKQEMVGWYEMTRSLDVDYVLSDQHWYFQQVATLYFDKIFLAPRTPEQYGDVIVRLYEHRVRRFAWVPAANSRLDPLLETARFAVQNVEGSIYEIVPID